MLSKNFLFVLLVISILSCSGFNSKGSAVYADTVIIQRTDTVILQDDLNRLRNDSTLLSQEDLHLRAVIRSYQDSVDERIFMNERRIEKIRYYIRITERNPKNKRFLLGWIKRTLSN